MGKKKQKTKTTLSVCMIAKNEEKLLPMCLASVQNLADEIILVDTGSTDRTVEIARQYGAKIFHTTWENDFSAARNESLEHATSDWLLYLDADEIVTEDNCRKIRKTISQNPEASGILVKVVIPQSSQNIVKTFGFEYCRLFKNHPEIRFERPIHEQIAPSIKRLNGKIIKSDIEIQDHWGNKAEKLGHRNQRNLEFLLAELKKFPNDFFIRFNLAVSYFSVHNYDAAIREFRSIIRGGNEHLEADLIAKAHVFLGQSLLLANKFEQAIIYSIKAAELLPNEPLPLFLAAMAAFKTNKIETAIINLEQVLALLKTKSSSTRMMEINPAQVYLQLGNCYYLKNDFPMAQKYYTQAQKYDSTSWEINFKLASCYFKTNEFSRAVPFFETAFKLNPTLKIAKDAIQKCKELAA